MTYILPQIKPNPEFASRSRRRAAACTAEVNTQKEWVAVHPGLVTLHGIGTAGIQKKLETHRLPQYVRPAQRR